jgi:transcriptional regulator with XRE-family HTH domain
MFNCMVRLNGATGSPKEGGSLKAKSAALGRVVGQRIAAARQRARLSQKELAAAIGAADGAISRYETGRFLPRQVTLIALSAILRTTTDYLYGLAPEPAAAAGAERETQP